MYTFDQKTSGKWAEFIMAMRSGNKIEIDKEIYYYFLEVLPPIFMNRELPFPDPKHPMRYGFGFAEGAEEIKVFWREGEKYFCQKTPFMNPAGLAHTLSEE
jgi:hypothetical protein